MRASDVRSKTARSDGGAATNVVLKSTDAVVTGWGMVTSIDTPARMSAARAGGSDQPMPSTSSRSAPREAASR